MKAIVKNKNSTSVSEIQKPVIKNDTDVLIRVAMAGICRTDIYVAQGLIKSKNPLVLGHEFSGFVEETGDQVAHVKTGQRVAVMPILPVSNDHADKPDYSNSTMIGIDHDGAFGEYVIVPASAVYAVPDVVSFKAAAYMEPIAASLAVMNADLQPQQKGLIYGENRISRLTQRIMNAKGLSDVELYDHRQSAAKPMDDNSYDYIIETLATTETMEHIVRAVKPGGKIVLKSRQHQPVAFDISTLVKKGITLQAVNYGDFSESIAMVSDCLLDVEDLFGDIYELEQFEEAFEKDIKGETKKLFFSTMGQDVRDS